MNASVVEKVCVGRSVGGCGVVDDMTDLCTTAESRGKRCTFVAFDRCGGESKAVGTPEIHRVLVEAGSTTRVDCRVRRVLGHLRKGREILEALSMRGNASSCRKMLIAEVQACP